MFNKFFGEGDLKSVTKWASISLVVFSVFLAVKIISDFKKLPSIGKEFYPQSTITVNGSGESYAIPDVATFSFTVTESSKTVEEAQNILNEKISKSLAVLKDASIDEKDIKTTTYNVYPKYEWKQVACLVYPCPVGKNEMVGYEVTQNITVKVRDLKKVGDLVTEIGKNEVSNISNVEFTVDNKEKYLAEAREDAIAEAKMKAKELSKQLGVKLGRILYYNENLDNPYYGEGYGMGGDGVMKSMIAPVKAELPQGESKITSNISITYEIK